MLTGEQLKEGLRDQYWRLNNLYYIQDKNNRTRLYQFTELQKRMFDECTGRDLILKARQQMVTTYWVIKWLDACLFNDNMTCVTIADSDENMQKMLSKAKFAYSHLPDFLKKLYPLRYSNRDEIYIGRRESKYIITLMNHSESVTKLHFSEVAFMKKDKERIDESMNSVPITNENAEIVFESIADGVGNEFHTRYVEAKNGVSDFKSHFFRWFDHSEYQLPFKTEGEQSEFIKSLKGDEYKAMIENKLTPEQMYFRRRKIMEGSGTIEEKVSTFLVKYPENDNDCFISTGKLLFDQQMVNDYIQHKEMQLVPLDIYSIGVSGRFLLDSVNGHLQVYEEPIEGEEYVLGGDVAKGIARGDYSILHVLNKRTFKQVAFMRIHCAPEIFGLYCYHIGLRYNGCLIAVEKNDRGHVAIMKLVNMKYRNLYYDGMERGMKLTEYGFTTSEKSRNLMLEQFTLDFRMGAFEKLHPILLDEMRTFIQNGNGKYCAIAGKKDDCVISFAITLQMCYLFPYFYRSRETYQKLLDYSGRTIDRKTGKEVDIVYDDEMSQYNQEIGNRDIIRQRNHARKVNKYSRGGKVNVIY